MKIREEKRVYVNQFNVNDYYQQFYPVPDDHKSYWR